MEIIKDLQILTNYSNFSTFYHLLDKFKFLLGVCIWASLGVLVGGLLLTLFRDNSLTC
ncbi:protein of unknown function [endosymbiont DhMRE of Dentiscutata heterogama]|uniref:hypothetical protein n=1 Tax=endosymbiont DhMRE of Dentiscutata heterogama TaxID=1609546 RepID=UPI000629DBE1|nr:hypothetical protein [endosymbiont DhMRE of Dentiscutata heterogama]CFW92996.1 protein of unknown function [endosymbiont DhMRE of Dentiscutata heterogama]